MTGPEHYQAAETWLTDLGDASNTEAATLALRTAQVHATLALAAASAPHTFAQGVEWMKTTTHETTF